MDRFLLCHPLSSASFWIYAGLLGLALIFTLLFVFGAVKSGGQVWVDYNSTTKVVKLRGSAVYAGLAVLAFVLLPTLSWLDHKVGLDLTPFGQRVDLKAGETLGVLRSKFEGRSPRRLLLGNGVENLVVLGEYEGTCAADMFYKICLQMGLACSWPASEPVMHIEPHGG